MIEVLYGEWVAVQVAGQMQDVEPAAVGRPVPHVVDEATQSRANAVVSAVMG